MIIAKLMSAQQLKSFSYQLIKEDEKLTRPMFFFSFPKTSVYAVFAPKQKKKQILQSLPYIYVLKIAHGDKEKR